MSDRYRPLRPHHAAAAGGCTFCAALQGLQAVNATATAGDPAGAPGDAGRRRFGRAALAAGVAGAFTTLPAWAREGVEVGRISRWAKFVPAESIEKAAQQNYMTLQQEAGQKGVLVGDNDPQVVRLRAIAQRTIPYTYEWNPRAREWQWEVNLIASPEINAFCMPGGKIAFYTGILAQLQLSDDEVAMIMGHEMAHALREHARERVGKQTATRGLIELGSSLAGLGSGGRQLANIGGQLLVLQFSREDESEADLVGLELAARAGYDPASGVTLWQKMTGANKGAPPQFLSTHPAGKTRIRDIQAALPKVTPLYARAERPPRRFGPPPPPKPAKG